MQSKKMKDFVKIFNEKSLLKLYSKYKQCDSGIIAASRSCYSEQENNHRTLALKTDLIRLGYSVTTINAIYTENYNSSNAAEVHEKIFIVFDVYGENNLKINLTKLGEKYNQDFIAYFESANSECILIGTNKTGYPGFNNIKILGKSMFGEDNRLFSHVIGRPFIFEQTSLNYFDYDCMRISYSISTIMMLKYADNFILSE